MKLVLCLLFKSITKAFPLITHFCKTNANQMKIVHTNSNINVIFVIKNMILMTYIMKINEGQNEYKISVSNSWFKTIYFSQKIANLYVFSNFLFFKAVRLLPVLKFFCERF